MIVKDNCPCKDCTDRQLGCHDTCDAYTQYSKERRRIRAEQAAQNQDYFAFVNRVYKHNRRKNI